MLAKDFITDSKLLKLLNFIEITLGVAIPAREMPLEHREKAKASIHWNLQSGEMEFLYIPNKTPQNIICHELMHIVLLIAGVPGFSQDEYPDRSGEGIILSAVNDLILHIKVWKMTKAYGFDEADHYDADMEPRLIRPIAENSMFPRMSPKWKIPGTAANIAHGLACPCYLDTKEKLRLEARRSCPQALDLAEQAYILLESSILEEPQKYVELHRDVVKALQLPVSHGVFLSIHPSRYIPGFDKQVMAL